MTFLIFLGNNEMELFEIAIYRATLVKFELT